MLFKSILQYSLLLTVAFALTGCQPKVYLMPSPIGFEEEPIGFHLSEDSIDANLLYTLYATNRLPFFKFPKAENSPSPDRFTIFPSDFLHLGYVVHRVGDENMSWENLQKESSIRDRSKDLLLTQIWSKKMANYDLNNNMAQNLDQAEGLFFEINRALDLNFDKDLLVYVHGANCNFYRATAQGAQFFHFTGHNSAVLTFSWPSAENIFKYKTDVLHAAKTVPAFSRLIEVLANNTKARKINILAYSAGAQVAAPGLAYFRDLYPELSTEELKKRLRIGEVYFAAPDTDFAPFIDRYMKFKDIVDRTTININANDTVLRISAIQNGISRLGRPDPEELTEEEALAVSQALQDDSLDILNVGDSKPLELGGSHSSWYSHPWVSNDLMLLMLFNLSPAERGLERYELGNGDIGFYFPEDYEQKIRKIIRTGKENLLQDKERYMKKLKQKAARNFTLMMDS